MRQLKKKRFERVTILTAAAVILGLSMSSCSREDPGGRAAANAGTASSAKTEAGEPSAKALELPGQAPAAGGAPRTAGGMSSADAELAAKVKAAVTATPGLEMLPFDVTVSKGAVTLYGTADTPRKRAQVEEIATRVPGVASVNNKLVIVAGS